MPIQAIPTGEILQELPNVQACAAIPLRAVAAALLSSRPAAEADLAEEEALAEAVVAEAVADADDGYSGNLFGGTCSPAMVALPLHSCIYLF